MGLFRRADTNYLNNLITKGRYYKMNSNFNIINNKIIIRTKGRLCETKDELVKSELFIEIVKLCIQELDKKESTFLNIFENGTPNSNNIDLLIKTLQNLLILETENVKKIDPESEIFFKDIHLFKEFIEYLYNFWRGFERYVICDSEKAESLDKRPYRTFNQTIVNLTQIIRSVYRDIVENLTSTHPRIYRQVTAGAQFAAISIPLNIDYPDDYKKLNKVAVIRQLLLNPPHILNPPKNTRTGSFVKIDKNPLSSLEFISEEWLCYPAKVGELIINIYFHSNFYELGFSLCNLFDLAEDEDLEKKPDAVYVFGAPEGSLDSLAEFPTVFFDDEKNRIFSAACPRGDEYGYFGYLKKMVLTLHNAIMIKKGRLPFHGAMVKFSLKTGKEATLLIIGDTGAGKSETLEAFRSMAADMMKGMTIIADDMGSIEINAKGEIIGYGTEIGAFLRLDDLQPGYALGQIDRSIIMSANRINARIVIPVTTFENIIKGEKIDYILYANNYDEIDDDHPVLEKIFDAEKALNIFREGTVMSKGTTTSTGLVHSYFANIFGAPQYRKEHDIIAQRFFRAFFDNGIFVGQIRTRLGLSGWEMKGPLEASKELLAVIHS